MNAHQNTLNLQQTQAIGLKYLGFAYAEISSKIGISENTLKDWFRSGGVLQVSYIEYAKNMNKTVIKEGEIALGSLVIQAVGVFRQALEERKDATVQCSCCHRDFIVPIETFGSLKLRVSKYVIDRIFGKPSEFGSPAIEQEDEIRGNPYSKFSDDEIRGMIKEHEKLLEQIHNQQENK